MTRTELLQQKVDQLKEQLQFSNDIRRIIEEQKIDQLSRMYHEYFEEVLEEGDEIEARADGVKFLRPQEGYNYNKELLNLYFRTKNWREDEADEIQTSFYSTSENSEFELRRMVLIGKVGQIVLGFYDDILAAYNQVQDQFKDALSKQMKEVFGLEREIREVNEQIRLIEKENLFSKLENEGIEFEVPENKSINELPNIDVRFDWTIFNVKVIKIIKKTTSGKSADIELKTMSNVWNPDTQSYNEKEQIKVVEKVRMNNVERFLQYYSNRISAS